MKIKTELRTSSLQAALRRREADFEAARKMVTAPRDPSTLKLTAAEINAMCGVEQTTEHREATSTPTGENVMAFTKKQIEELSNAEVVAMYNERAPILDYKPVKKFKNSAEGVERLLKVLKDNGELEAKAKATAAKPAAKAKKEASGDEGEPAQRGRASVDYSVKVGGTEPARMNANSIRTRVLEYVKASKAKNGVARSAICEAFPNENADSAIAYLVKADFLARVD